MAVSLAPLSLGVSAAQAGAETAQRERGAKEIGGSRAAFPVELRDMHKMHTPMCGIDAQLWATYLDPA